MSTFTKSQARQLCERLLMLLDEFDDSEYVCMLKDGTGAVHCIYRGDPQTHLDMLVELANLVRYGE